MEIMGIVRDVFGFVVGGGLVVLATLRSTRHKAKAEAQEADLDIINKAINPLLESIKSLTEQNKECIDKYLQVQDENINLKTERSELLERVEALQKQVDVLTKKLNNFIKNEKIK